MAFLYFQCGNNVEMLLRKRSVQIGEVSEMDETVFRISKSFRSSLMGATILGTAIIAVVGGLVASAWTESLNQRQREVVFWLGLTFSMLVVAGIIWCIYTLKQIKYKVVVAATGIQRIPESAPAASVAWSDIVAVEDRMRANRLRLYGVGNHVLMELDWQLESADKLQELIHQKVYRDRRVHEGMKHFRLQKGANTHGILPVIAGVCFALLSGMQGAYIPSIFFAAMTVGAFISWARLAQVVTIMPDELQLRTLLKLRSIPWREISQITLSAIKDERSGGSGRTYRIVKALMKNGKPLQMPPVREGSLLLFDALTHAHKMSQT